MNSLSINFNQDFTSLSVVGATGYRLFSLLSVDRVEELFCSNNESVRIAERLFTSSLVAVVTGGEPNKLTLCHFKKGTEICFYFYPTDILSVRLNRSRLIVCLREHIYLHNIRDMKLIHCIRLESPNPQGLCSLSFNSYLSYPISQKNGELEVFNATDLKSENIIKAHDSLLSAMNFSSNGVLIATASERGTVIRVFCSKNGQKVHEFRRGVKRNATIASLIFSSNGDYLCASSNTETIHIFKIDPKLVEYVECLETINSKNCNNTSKEDLNIKRSSSGPTWTGFLTKAVTFIPSQVSDVFSQNRAFATIQLNQAGLKYVCILAKIENETRLLVASEDGFLYIYDFNDVRGGECKLICAHDLRNPLEGITEIDISESYCDNRMNSDDINCESITQAAMKKPNKICNNNQSVITQTDKMENNVNTLNKIKSTMDTYAGVLKGDKNVMTDSVKFRDLSEAVSLPAENIFDENQFPPVQVSNE